MSPRPAAPGAEQAAIRLDKWLWQARFVKSRARAAALIEAGNVRVNAQRALKPAAQVRPGDGVSFALDGRVHVVRVLAVGTRRGPAPEARRLYDDLTVSGPAEPSARGLEPGEGGV